MIYLDHAATTNVRSEVLDAMLPWFSENYGNPSSIYGIGRKSKKAIEEAREQISTAIGCEAREIYFTSGGTESDNWALKGTAFSQSVKGKHIITSAIEHHAVMHTCMQLEKEGYEVTYLPVDPDGLVDPEHVAAAIRKETILVSIMMANNEIGTLQPISKIGSITREKGVLFHTDAVQAAGAVPVNVQQLNVDMLSLSSHKFYGPKGVGALYIRRGLKFPAFLHGGAQERNRRAGTENVPAIVGMGKALMMATEEIDAYASRMQALRDATIEKVMARIPHTRLNGHKTLRLPGNCNFSFEYIEGESLLLLLDMKGIAASSGSACSSGSLDPSHVLLALGLRHETAHGSLRITYGRQNREEDVDTLVENLIIFVNRLREMSPLYEASARNRKEVENRV